MNTPHPTTTTSHIDYREAFVIDMEMAAHGGSCKTCQVAALKAKPQDFCHRMVYMREYIRRAYEALPPYYKDRYTEAVATAFKNSAAELSGYTGG